MNINDYQFHPQYHRPMASIIYLANWWIFLGMMIVVAPIRIVMFISRQVNVVEDMGRVENNQPLMNNYSIGYWSRQKFVYY